MLNLSYFVAGQCGVPALCYGMPGVAKTAVMEAFSRKQGRALYTLIGSIREPGDIGGYPALDEEDGLTFMKIVPPKYLLDARKTPTNLFIDEIMACAPAVQAALLRVANEKEVGDESLPDDCDIYAACNPPSITPNGFPFEAPTANRWYHHQWLFPREDWLAGMAAGGNFPVPDVPILPDSWEENMMEMGALVAQFHRRTGRFLMPESDDEGEPKLSVVERSKAWPSPRSWHNATKCLAAGMSLDVDDGVKKELVEGNVGMGASEAFFQFWEALDIPDSEEILQKVVDARADKREDISSLVPELETDQLIVFLGALNGNVGRDNSLDRWNAAQDIYIVTSDREAETSLSQCGPLYRDPILPSGAVLSDTMADSVERVFGRALGEVGYGTTS